jgi:hypothetical protein
MFSSHNPAYTHSQGYGRTMALIAMDAGVIVAPAAVIGLLFFLAKLFAGI